MFTVKNTFLTLGLGTSFWLVAFVFMDTRHHYTSGGVTEQSDRLLHYSPSPSVQNVTHIRILCWVMTSPATLNIKGRAVKETWGKRCDILLFMSSQADPSFPAIGLDVQEGRDHLWEKTRKAWRYVHEHHLHEADWFMKVDDDTFVIVENLRHFVRKLDTEEAHFLGRKFKRFGSFNSGGAGYVFSRHALRIFAKLLDDPSRCKTKARAEDVETSRCFQAEGVLAEDTRDELGRETFHCFRPEHHLIPGFVPKERWGYKNSFFPYIDGPDCCSDQSISFHYVTPNMMYVLDFLIYRLRPYGLGGDEVNDIDSNMLDKL